MDGAKWNREGFGLRRRSQHVATPVKDTARFNEEAGRVNLAGDYTFRLNFHATLRKDDPVKSSGYDHLISFNLTLGVGLLAEQEPGARNDVPLDLGLQPECARQFESTLQADTLVEKAHPLFRTRLFVAPSRPLPGQG